MNNNQYLDQVYEINFKDKKNYDEFIKSINSKKIEYNTLLGEADTGI